MRAVWNSGGIIAYQKTPHLLLVILQPTMMMSCVICDQEFRSPLAHLPHTKRQQRVEQRVRAWAERARQKTERRRLAQQNIQHLRQWRVENEGGWEEDEEDEQPHLLDHDDDDNADQQSPLGPETTCYVCSEEFRTEEEMWDHYDSVHDTGQRWVCVHCSETFDTSEDVYMHEELMHPE